MGGTFGQRVAKHVFDNQTELLEKSTYYILDAQGQQLSMYEHTVDTAVVKYYLTERNIYGSSRIGVTRDTINMFDPQLLPSYGVLGNRNYELNNHLGNVLQVIGDQIYPLPPVETVFENDFEENIDGFSAHPNVSINWESGRMKIATVEKWDKVKLIYTTEPGQLYRFKFVADLAGQGIIATNCYDRPNLTFTNQLTIHSNGAYHLDVLAVSDRTEISFESGIDGNRIFYIDDVVLEKRTAIYANDLISTWDGMEKYGSNVTLGIEDKKLKVSTVGSENGVKQVFSTVPGKNYRLNFTVNPSGGGNVTAALKDVETNTLLQNYSTSAYTRTYMDFTALSGETEFSMENTVSGARSFYIGAVFAQEIDPVTVQCYAVSLMNSYDYSPFGVQLDGRTFDDENYRYGFQNQEKDDEIKGSGNSVNYEYRMHDPRLGRFFATDPLTSEYPFYSPYQFSGNILINAVELEGLEPNVLFKTQDQAAVNFGKYYNDNSIREGIEYGASIYKVTDADTKKVMYAYNEATPGSSHKVAPNESVPEGSVLVATVHTHGKYLRETDNQFSGEQPPHTGDIGKAVREKVDSYVATPQGAMRKFDIKKYTIQQIYDKLPSDPKDPARLNNVPSDYENHIKLGHIEFNSDLARKRDGYLIVTDLKTKKDYGVVRDENGKYDFYRKSNNTSENKTE